jgi:hypothetical protein
MTRLAVWSVAVGICFFAGDLMAWQSKPIDYNKCRKKKQTVRCCEKKNAEANLHTFMAELNSDSLDYFNSFSTQQQRQAMNLADGNQMSPNEAVARIQSEK